VRIVIAPDSFKGSLAASLVASAIADGWRSVRPDDELLLIPQADGGEGTLDAIEAAVPGAARRSAGLVTGPDGRPTPGEWLSLPDEVAVVELAQASGLPLMDSLDPMGAQTRGMGEVIRAAILDGAESLVVALGGSASTDGGRGALEALGWPSLILPPPGGVILLTDVTAPLLGPTGAAAVFGPQKGASPAQVAELDARLSRWADRLGGDPAAPGAGAAGGTAYGLATAWGAAIRPGASYIADLTGATSAIAGADLLITGEGRFDDQSLGGKVVGSLIAQADIPVAIIAGQLAAAAPGWAASLVELAGSVDAAMGDPVRWLRAAGAKAAREA